jgi:hypothetical protein
VLLCPSLGLLDQPVAKAPPLGFGKNREHPEVDYWAMTIQLTATQEPTAGLPNKDFALGFLENGTHSQQIRSVAVQQVGLSRPPASAGRTAVGGFHKRDDGFSICILRCPQLGPRSVLGYHGVTTALAASLKSTPSIMANGDPGPCGGGSRVEGCVSRPTAMPVDIGDPGSC